MKYYAKVYSVGGEKLEEALNAWLADRWQISQMTPLRVWDGSLTSGYLVVIFKKEERIEPIAKEVSE